MEAVIITYSAPNVVKRSIIARMIHWSVGRYRTIREQS
jgi:hypothetical protein